MSNPKDHKRIEDWIKDTGLGKQASLGDLLEKAPRTVQTAAKRIMRENMKIKDLLSLMVKSGK